MNDNQELILKGRYTAYMEQIEKYYNGTIDRTQPIVIGMTTNALAISGADSSLELTINIKISIPPPSAGGTNSNESVSTLYVVL